MPGNARYGMKRRVRLSAAAVAAGSMLTLRAASSRRATVWTIALYHLLHVALALVMGLYVLARFRAGRLRPKRDIDLRNAALFWHFTVLMGLVALAVIDLFPLATA